MSHISVQQIILVIYELITFIFKVKKCIYEVLRKIHIVNYISMNYVLAVFLYKLRNTYFKLAYLIFYEAVWLNNKTCYLIIL